MSAEKHADRHCCLVAYNGCPTDHVNDRVANLRPLHGRATGNQRVGVRVRGHPEHGLAVEERNNKQQRGMMRDTEA